MNFEIEKIEGMSFEVSLRELENVVKMLEGGNIELEVAMKAYHYGQKLKEHCDKKLEHAKLRIQEIVKDEAGAATGVKNFEGSQS